MRARVVFAIASAALGALLAFLEARREGRGRRRLARMAAFAGIAKGPGGREVAVALVLLKKRAHLPGQIAYEAALRTSESVGGTPLERSTVEDVVTTVVPSSQRIVLESRSLRIEHERSARKTVRVLAKGYWAGTDLDVELGKAEDDA